MMARGIEKLFPTLEELGIGFVAYSPLANGLLSGAYEKATNKNFEAVVDYRSRMPQFTPEAMKKNEELMAFLQKTAEEHSATMSQLSLAWMLGKHSWLTAIPSSRKLERIVENAGGAVVKLSAEEIKAIDEALDKLPKSDIFGVKNN
jgi:aryl-alcohol dehydrogenase-like predicted oxidoreductase